MKSICFFSGDIDRAGGTERVSTVIANALSNRGYKVCFLSLENGNKPFYTLNKEIALYSLKMEGKSKKRNFLNIIKSLRLFLKKHQIDHIIDIDIVLSIYSIPATLNLSTKVVSWEHFNYFAKVGNKRQNFERQIARFLASKRAKTIVTLTDKDRNYYLDNLNCKAEVVTIFNPLTIEKSGVAELSNKTVLSVGRLTYQKGYDLLLPAWKLVHEKYPEWKLQIVGSGKDEQMLKQMAQTLRIKESVEFIPVTKDIADYYLNTSIYVMSSRYEGFGLVLSEAKAFGLPLISFDCDCGPSDIIRDGIDGFLVKEKDIEGMAQSITKMIQDEKLRSEMGRKGAMDDRFKLEQIVNKWESILEDK